MAELKYLSEYDTTIDRSKKVGYEEHSTFSDLMYNFNSIGAYYRNQTDNKLSLDEARVQREKDSGYTFSWDNKDIKELVDKLPDGMLEDIPANVRSKEELLVTINRLEEQRNSLGRLHKEYGTLGTMALAAPVALLDWDSIGAIGLVGKTRKALDFYKVTNTTARTAAYSVAGATEGLVSDAVYQHVMNTSSTDQRVASFFGGGVLAGTIGKYVIDKDIRTIESKVNDPIYGPREPTPTELASLKIEDNKLKVNLAEEKLKEAEDKLKDFEVKQTKYEEEISVLPTAIKAKKAEVSKLQKEVADHETVVAREKFEEAKTANEKAVKELKEAKKELKLLPKEIAKVKSKIAKLEIKLQGPNKVQDLITIKKELSANKETLKPLEVKRTSLDISKLETDVYNTSRVRKRHQTSVSKKSIEGKLKSKDIENTKTKLSKASEELSILSDRYTKLKKRKASFKNVQKVLKSRYKEAELEIKTHQTRLNEAIKYLEDEVPIEVAKNDAENRLELNWAEKMLVWTPGTYLHSSTNPVLRGLGQKLISPYKALKSPDGKLVPTKPNAMYHKKLLEGLHTNMYYETTVAYSKAIKEEGFKGTYKEFMEKVGAEYRKQSSVALRKAHSAINTNHTTEEELLDLIKEAEASLKLEFNSKSNAVNDSCNSLRNMYIEYGKEGKAIGATGFTDIILNGTYMPRAFSYDKIRQVGTKRAIELLAQAMAEHPANYYNNDLLKEAEAIINKVQDNSTLYNMLELSEHGTPEVSPSKQRTINYYEDRLLDILESDTSEVAAGYAYKMSGRLALHKYLNVSTGSEIHNLYSNLSTQGVTEKDLANLEAVIDTILGTREIMKNPNSLNNKAMRLMTKANSIIYGTGFGVTALTEIANVIGTTGFKNTIGNHFGSIQAAIKMARGGNAPTEWMNELRAAGLMGEIIHGLHIQKFDSTDSISSKGVVEKLLDFGVHYVHKLSGLQHITEATRALSLGAGFNYISELARKLDLTDVELKRLNRIGIDSETLNEVRKLIDDGTIKYNDKGHLQSFNFDKWSPKVKDKIQFALYNHLESTVLHPNGATLPLFLSDPNSFLSKILFQFMRFPAATHETLFLRGINEFDAKQLQGIISSAVLFTLVAQIKDLNRLDKPMYDLETEEGRANLMGYLAAGNYFGGSLVTKYDTVYSLLTGKRPFSDYNQGSSTALGVTAATLSSVQKSSSDIIDGDYVKAFEGIQNPIKHLPAIMSLFDIINGE